MKNSYMLPSDLIKPDVSQANSIINYSRNIFISDFVNKNGKSIFLLL